MIKIPHVSARPDFKQMCKTMNLQARGGAGVDNTTSGGIWDISNGDRLGMSEVDLVNKMIEGCAALVKMEQDMEAGGTGDIGLPSAAPPKPKGISAPMGPGGVPDYAKMPGLGDAPYPGFPTDSAPDQMPDLYNHHSIMADVLKQNPSIYAQLKNKRTKMGVTFAACVKTGMDNKGSPMLKTVGMTAGDEESYDVFKMLFDPVISIRHGGYAPDARHPTDLDASKLSSKSIDPSGKYAISVRVRSGRSLRGLRLPPSCTMLERREVERVVAKSLLKMQNGMKGDYYPLAGSESYIPKPGGMTYANETAMREENLHFEEPDSSLLLSSGMGRHWPDGRGIFANDASTLIVWANEEDHTRIISMRWGRI
jgi:creatine kinase